MQFFSPLRDARVIDALVWRPCHAQPLCRNAWLSDVFN